MLSTKTGTGGKTLWLEKVGGEAKKKGVGGETSKDTMILCPSGGYTDHCDFDLLLFTRILKFYLELNMIH